MRLLKVHSWTFMCIMLFALPFIEHDSLNLHYHYCHAEKLKLLLFPVFITHSVTYIFKVRFVREYINVKQQNLHHQVNG